MIGDEVTITGGFFEGKHIVKLIVTKGKRLKITINDTTIYNVPLDNLEALWKYYYSTGDENGVSQSKD